MARKIQHKRGLEANLPQLDEAEIAFTTDSKKPFIGSADGNVEIAKKKDVDEALANKANATTVQGLSQTVNAKADVEYVETELAKKADTTALETKADVTALETKADKEEVTTLSAQLADTSQEVETVKATKADKAEVTAGLELKRDKTVPIGLNDADSDLLTAIQGGTTVEVLSIPRDHSVTPLKTSFLVRGKNLFDKTAALQGYYLDANGAGNTYPSSTQSVSGFIPVKPNTQYTSTDDTINIAYYDSNQTKIGGKSASTVPITTPENTAFVRFSFDTAFLDTMQFEEGTTRTAYEPYGFKIDEGQVRKFSIDTDDIPDRSITKEKLSILRPSKNLFNKNTASVGTYLVTSSGNTGTSSNYTTSDFIPVDGGVSYSFRDNSNFRIVYYDAGKVYISADDLVKSPITTPANARFIRFHFNHNETSLDAMQFEKGTEQTEYEPYGLEYLDDSIKVHGASELSGSTSSHLSGKNVVFFGDSITGAYSPPNDYPTVVANRLGIEAYNVGFSGAKMSTDNSQTDYDAFSMAQIVDAMKSGDWSIQEAEQDTSQHYPEKLARLQSIDFNDIDIVTIFYGTNDFNSSIPKLDNETDKFDKTTVLGAARYSIRTLLELYPHLKIVLLCPTWRTVGEGYADDTPSPQGYYMREFAEGFKSVSEEFHIPFIDMYYGINMNQYNYSIYLYDGLHPNTEGKELIGNRIASQMQSMF